MFGIGGKTRHHQWPYVGVSSWELVFTYYGTDTVEVIGLLRGLGICTIQFKGFDKACTGTAISRQRSDR